MAAYEVLLLNTAIPQIQAAQSGDTYVVPRDIAFSTVANLANGTNLLPSLTFSSDTNTGIYREGADALGFTAGGGTNQMVLTSTGLGIGTSSPGAKLHTQQTSAGSRVTGALLQNVGDSASTAVSLDFAPHENTSSPSILARINAERTAQSNAPTDLVFSTFNSTLQERARITSGGNLDLQKNIGLGGASATTSGTGITFPATQSASSDANTLDDYEEGTYVVTLTPDTSGSITLNSSNNELSYIKVGSQVTIFGRILISSVSSPVGAIRISMPFTPETGLVDQSDFYAMPMFTHDVDLSAGALSVFGESSGTNYWVIFQTLDNAAWTALPAANLKGNGNEYFYITGSYRAA